MENLRLHFIGSCNFLPSCFLVDWVKGKKETTHVADGKAVVKMAGKVVITDASFEQEFEQLIEENPHLKSVLALIQTQEKFLGWYD